MGCHSSFRLLGLLGLLASAAFSGGCVIHEPAYVQGYRFAPEPALTVMRKPGSQVPAVSMLTSIIGLRYGAPSNNVPPALEIRMRIENTGSQPLTFDPRSAILVNGALQSFDPPEAHTNGPVHVAANQTDIVTLYFPFPPHTYPREMPLDTLRLRWQVELEGQSYLQTAFFERVSGLRAD